MRLLSLDMQNVGPFDEAHLEFLPAERSEDERPKVALITGENGTGKTICLDAIRGLFGPEYTLLERAIWRPTTAFQLQMCVEYSGQREQISASAGVKIGGTTGAAHYLNVNSILRVTAVRTVTEPKTFPRWILDYWRTGMATDSYEIQTLGRQDPTQYLRGALNGIYKNADVTALICEFDYLRSSEDPKDKRSGEALYDIAKRIINQSLTEGEFKYVQRRTYTPIVTNGGQEVPISNLSSGNAYLIQHLIRLLGKMYAVHQLLDTDPSEICTTPGLLLIDEAENHLHPKWQKRFLNDILAIFPNLQIIATTHSPFIVASVAGAKVFVCRYDKERKTCVIDKESADYANQPIDEILMSPAFDGTQPFNQEITDLLAQRKDAHRKGDKEERKRIEAQLKNLNPDYFSYFDIDEKLGLSMESEL